MNIMEIAMKTDGDDLAWKREFDRIEAKQKRAQPVVRTWADEMVDMLFDNNCSEIKDDDYESNNQ